jgi:hypothetical protein
LAFAIPNYRVHDGAVNDAEVLELFPARDLLDFKQQLRGFTAICNKNA